MREAVQQQLQQRPAWQTLLVPAAGIGLITLLFGERFFGICVSMQSTKCLKRAVSRTSKDRRHSSMEQIDTICCAHEVIRRFELLKRSSIASCL